MADSREARRGRGDETGAGRGKVSRRKQQEVEIDRGGREREVDGWGRNR